MTEIVMPAGKLGRKYSKQGAKANGRLRSRYYRLYRVDGEVVTFRTILERTGATEENLLRTLNKWLQRNERVTWDALQRLKKAR